MSREELIGLVMRLEPEFMAYQRENVECDCDCIMKKSPHYLIYNSSKKELISYLESSIHNMTKTLEQQHEIINHFKEKTPPTYEETCLSTEAE
jgi:hypothetical protein